MKPERLIITIFTFLFTTGSLSSQTVQGKYLIGEFSNIKISETGVPTYMNIGYTTSKIKSDSGLEENAGPSEFSMNLIPRFGYFVIDNLAVGIDVTLSFSHSKGYYESTRIHFGAGPFIRYYIPTPTVLPFAELSYSIGSQTYNSDDFRKYQVQQYGLGVGCGFPLGEKVSFDTVVGYQSYISKEKNDNEENERFITTSIGLKLGLTIIL